jgi:hypothetical protein
MAQSTMAKRGAYRPPMVACVLHGREGDWCTSAIAALRLQQKSHGSV